MTEAGLPIAGGSCGLEHPGASPQVLGPALAQGHERPRGRVGIAGYLARQPIDLIDGRFALDPTRSREQSRLLRLLG
ncbi:MAG: hypothetical protein ACRDH5_09485, partial [bacterium]